MQERNNTSQVVAQCRKWISDCFGNHEVCRQRVGAIENWLPTRLLDTGSPSEPPSVRLVISTNLNAARTSYLALSHCWGKLEIIILRLSTLDEFQEGIPLAALPRTFQHAVVMTRALGYRYLWIDSLCIIQDSSDDWQYEATLMGEVYGQADCVLAATGSKDGNGGLFQEREPQLFAPFEVGAKFVFHNETYLCIRKEFWERELANAPLNQRGWVVQERMLSPRTLQFGKNQIFWQCREVEACETLPKEIPQDFIYFGDRDGDGFKRWMQPDSGARSIALGPYDPWGHVVEVYTRTLLTKSQDKLIAISGIARKMSLTLDDVYLAGLWRNNLINGLLWKVNMGEQIDGSPSRRTTVYRAPTWSWASIDGMVTQVLDSDLYGDDLVSILDASTDPVGSDEYGQLKGGRITLEGIVKLIRKPSFFYFSGNDISGTYHPDDYHLSQNMDECYILPLRYHRIARFFEDELWGLVIRPIRSIPNGFERVGLFQVNEEEDICNVGNLKGGDTKGNYGLTDSEERRIIHLL